MLEQKSRWLLLTQCQWLTAKILTAQRDNLVNMVAYHELRPTCLVKAVS